MRSVQANPLVSVVIPAYNAEAYLGDAIESVLAQTYPRVELIVVDDGSTDATGEIAEGFPGAKVIGQENAGPAIARNRGFAASTGELIAFHDADDVMVPDKLEVQVECLLADDGIGVVMGEQEVVVEQGSELPFWVEGSSAQSEMPTRPAEHSDEPLIHPMTMLMRREVFELVGPFDAAVCPAEDIDWALRSIEVGIETARLPRVVLRRRVHPQSLTQNTAAARAGLFRAFKARIERRRAHAAG
jgi:glycosyltransferase involved in cell wall biosynthesis